MASQPAGAPTGPKVRAVARPGHAGLEAPRAVPWLAGVRRLGNTLGQVTATRQPGPKRAVADCGWVPGGSAC
eukprot:11198264-Lingulodinium_polyedra.AAC.1